MDGPSDEERIAAIERRADTPQAFVFPSEVRWLLDLWRGERVRASQLADALTAIEKKDTKLRKTKRCSDPQCGDSTWDHDCDEEWDTAPGPFAEIARAALAVPSRAAKED